MSRTHRKYADAHKTKTVELVLNSSRPVTEIDRELEGARGSWMNMAKKHGEVAEKPLAVEDRNPPPGTYSRQTIIQRNHRERTTTLILGPCSPGSNRYSSSASKRTTTVSDRTPKWGPQPS